MARASINSGDLDQRVTLLRPVFNEFQDEITGWEVVAETWAAVLPEDAAEVTESGRTITRTNVRMILRFRTDLDTRFRVRHGAATYELVGLVNPHALNESLHLTCREIL